MTSVKHTASSQAGKMPALRPSVASSDADANPLLATSVGAPLSAPSSVEDKLRDADGTSALPTSSTTVNVVQPPAAHLEQQSRDTGKMPALRPSPKEIEHSSQDTHEARGTHLLLTLFGCPADLLNDEQALRSLTEQASLATGATILQLSSHKFTPQGVTALAVLAESHASIHTYPESGTVFWDCFTCGQTCKPELSIAVLVEALKPNSMQKQMILRGNL